MIADRHTKFLKDIGSPTEEESCARPEKLLKPAYKENLAGNKLGQGGSKAGSYVCRSRRIQSTRGRGMPKGHISGEQRNMRKNFRTPSIWFSPVLVMCRFVHNSLTGSAVVHN